VSVVVKPGRVRSFKSGFLWRFPGGNVGFAIRLRPGDTVRSVERFTPYQVKRPDGKPSGLFILYGPSVDQVFGFVAEQIMPEVTSALEAEFDRQFARLSGATP